MRNLISTTHCVDIFYAAASFVMCRQRNVERGHWCANRRTDKSTDSKSKRQVTHQANAEATSTADRRPGSGPQRAAFNEFFVDGKQWNSENLVQAHKEYNQHKDANSEEYQ